MLKTIQKHTKRYTRWLHTQWPAGRVEKLPEVREDFSTNLPGVYIVGDLTGIPLLKLASESGVKAVQHIISSDLTKNTSPDTQDGSILDLAIIGGGVSGMAAAIEAQKAGITFEILEATEPFSTIVNFPKGKPIYTYPTDLKTTGGIEFTATVKEALVDELRAQTLEKGILPKHAKVERIECRGSIKELLIADGTTLLARSVIIAIGRSGNFRKLGVPGEELEKVYNRLHDPKDFCDKNVLVVGGGDSGLETAIAIAECGGKVTLSCRGKELNRPKPENLKLLQKFIKISGSNADTTLPENPPKTLSGLPDDAPLNTGSIDLRLGTNIKEIRADDVIIVDASGKQTPIPNDVVFMMIGRDAPLDFFRRSGIKIKNEMTPGQWTLLGLFLLFCTFIYNWKAGGALTKLFQANNWFPFNLPSLYSTLGESIASQAVDPSTLVGTLATTLNDAGFYYSLLYTLLVVIFGYLRIKRRKTPYVTVQTFSLAAVQIIPLFLLPYFILPIMGQQGLFDTGIGRVIADELFPVVNYGYGRAYWRSFGLILAWPLFIWNVFTTQPLWGWLIISFVQTFVIIPLMIYKWGKGAYCGFICSCGAMAETLGDTHRHKMPHGPGWNRMNMVGQVILFLAFLLLTLRIVSWALPASGLAGAFEWVFYGMLSGWTAFGVQLNYKWVVDLLLAGILGYGLYFWYSGRVWCRFACPLAALMHIYTRFSRFRILADKDKCISCNVCTSVCHQGIDVMNFANKGLAMNDPECVRCSACVQSCPTGVLAFGEVDTKTGKTIRVDGLMASPVRGSEGNIP